MKQLICFATLFSLFSSVSMAGQDVVSQPTNHPPGIDGNANDDIWKTAPVTTTHDTVANIDIDIQSAHNDQTIFFLVRFPDSSETRQHKYLVWDDTLKVYRTGKKREDSFVFKWNMEPRPVDLALYGDDPYKADIWYWKANRTDPIGFADDKHHIYGQSKLKKSRIVVSHTGKQFYLTRLSDSGKSAYSSQTYEKFSGPEVPRYKNRQPTGSRADVRAKGTWDNGYWTIEFSRPLQTGHPDDVQFDPDRSYSFGVSRYEIAGKPANKGLEQALYESGDISELFTLKWK